MKIRVKWLWIAVAAFFLVSAHWGVAPPPASAQKRVTIKGGQIRGAFNRWTSAWAIFLTKEIKGVQVSSESSTGSPENVRAVDSGSVEMGLVFASDLYQSYRGQGQFKKPHKNIRVLTYLFGSVGHFLAPASSGFKKLEDIKGKVVSMGGPGSGSAKNLTMLLKHMGLWGKFKPVYLGRKSPAALRNGKIAAYNWHPGLGNAMIRDTASMMKIRFIDMNEPAKKTGFYKKFPFFGTMTIPAGLYPNVNVDTKTFGTGSIMTANKNLSADLVYNILKLIYSKKGKDYLLSAAGKVTKQMTKGNAFNFVTVPLHPGAARFWKEQGKTVPSELMP
ncbi:MAG: TAXI family TRAP transporter solute-binding subunit [bacterium]